MKPIKEYLNEGLIRRQLGPDMRAKIENWLKQYEVSKYTINKDLSIDVEGTVNLTGYTDKKLPDYIQFRKITENFYFENSPNLESLKGCPKEVGGDFCCFRCSNLKSLEGCPKEVGGYFWCNNCSNLKSLEGCPKEVGKGFWCYGCSKQFTEDDVKKICKVKGVIVV